VGLPLPRVILAALRRLVGSRHAERLAVRGLLITPADAAACGLVDELALADQVVDRALKWCEGLLALPRGSNGDHSSAGEILPKSWPRSPPGGGAKKRRRHFTGWWSNSRSTRDPPGIKTASSSVVKPSFMGS